MPNSTKTSRHGYPVEGAEHVREAEESCDNPGEALGRVPSPQKRCRRREWGLCAADDKIMAITSRPPGVRKVLRGSLGLYNYMYLSLAFLSPTACTYIAFLPRLDTL